jgi:hypothetical protein
VRYNRLLDLAVQTADDAIYHAPILQHEHVDDVYEKS